MLILECKSLALKQVVRQAIWMRQIRPWESNLTILQAKKQYTKTSVLKMKVLLF